MFGSVSIIMLSEARIAHNIIAQIVCQMFAENILLRLFCKDIQNIVQIIVCTYSNCSDGKFNHAKNHIIIIILIIIKYKYKW